MFPGNIVVNWVTLPMAQGSVRVTDFGLNEEWIEEVTMTLRKVRLLIVKSPYILFRVHIKSMARTNPSNNSF